eukprot:m.163420 g.163420  ORF g.163420 m.163420 type:complete len:457 (-) comp24915_c0_seq3:530-1900(-)
MLSGNITLPSYHAFGVWYSHYQAYSQQEFEHDILAQYQNLSLPINVLVSDMDWHIEPNVAGCVPFNAYTWNTTLFPDHQGFIETLHNGSNPTGRHLRFLVNTHNFDGVDHCQDVFKKFQSALGLPSSNDLIHLNLTNLDYMVKFFDIVLDSIGDIDYFWVDGSLRTWSKNTGQAGPWNLFWQTHQHAQIIAVENRRPLVLTRNGGVGQHRYPIGFSGDAESAWVTLEAEIFMTAKASNILFAYWSHDIGGFLNNPSPELYARWCQFGSVAPILRTHGRKGTERRIWEYNTFEVMAQALRYRAVLAPYFYTLAKNAYEHGIGPLRPMYYQYPDFEGAYNLPLQYMVGDALLVRPIAESAINNSARARGTAGSPCQQCMQILSPTSSPDGFDGTNSPTTANISKVSVWVPPGTFYIWQEDFLAVSGPDVYDLPCPWTPFLAWSKRAPFFPFIMNLPWT